MIKKSVLLAGVAVLLANSANAMEFKDLNPYVGLDYAYSKADYKGKEYDKKLKDEYNSGIFNAGIRPMDNFSLEAFFQQSGELKGGKYMEDGQLHRMKSEFYAYGLDAYGYMPIGCSGFNLLGTVGVANYNMKVKSHDGSVDKQRIGYRAGIGAQYDIDENWSARVVGRYSYLNSNALDNLQEVTVGLRYTF